MRAKVIFAVLAGMLLCSLPMLEMSEFLRLADDTSNDFAAGPVRAETPSESAVPESSADARLRPGAARPSVFAEVPRAGFAVRADGLLHRLCILRT